MKTLKEYNAAAGRRPVQSRRARRPAHRGHRAAQDQLGAEARHAAVRRLSRHRRHHVHVRRPQDHQGRAGGRHRLEADPGPVYVRRNGRRAVPLQLSARHRAHVGRGVRPHRRTQRRGRLRDWASRWKTACRRFYFVPLAERLGTHRHYSGQNVRTKRQSCHPVRRCQRQRTALRVARRRCRVSRGARVPERLQGRRGREQGAGNQRPSATARCARSSMRIRRSSRPAKCRPGCRKNRLCRSARSRSASACTTARCSLPTTTCSATP